MATNAQGKPSATDFTGSKRAELQKAHAKELADKQDAMSLAFQAEQEKAENEVLDVTVNAALPVVVVDEVEVLQTDDSVVIRVNEDLQDVTIGDQNYNFIAGRKYKVPANVKYVLEGAGRLWL